MNPLRQLHFWFSWKIAFSNTAALADPGALFRIFFSNAIEPATEDGWLKLMRAGNWPHVGGMQRVTPQSLANVAAEFKSLSGQMGRMFEGVPIFIGHPDDPSIRGKTGHDDTKAYGWVQDLKVVGNELWVKPRWSEDGQKILSNAHYRFLSPRWNVKSIGGGNYEPVRLISIGLTNHPNIPGDAIANEQPTTMKLPQWIKALLAKLGFSNEQIIALEGDNAAGAPTEAQILGKADALLTASNEAATLSNEKTALGHELAAAKTAETTAKQKAADHLAAFSNERAKRIELLIATGIREGKIPPSNKDAWATEFSNSFEPTLTKLAVAPIVLPTKGREHDDRKPADPHTSKKDQIVAFCNENLPKCNQNWDAAYAKTRQEHPDLFETEAKK